MARPRPALHRSCGIGSGNGSVEHYLRAGSAVQQPLQVKTDQLVIAAQAEERSKSRGCGRVSRFELLEGVEIGLGRRVVVSLQGKRLEGPQRLAPPAQ